MKYTLWLINSILKVRQGCILDNRTGSSQDTKNIEQLPFQAAQGWFAAIFLRLETYVETVSPDQDIPISKHLFRVFYACLFVTLLASAYHIHGYNEQHRQYSQQLISKFNTQVDETFQRYFSMLHGVRAVFSMSLDITLKQWKPYSQQIMYRKRYPGIHSISVIRPVSRPSLDLFLQQDRRLNKRTLKILSPESYVGDEFDIIQYTTSTEGTDATGLNIRQYDVARKALDFSRDEDKSQMIYIPKLRSQPEAHEGHIFILYTPIYKANTTNTTALSRRENFYGWVASPLHIKELFQDIIASDPDFKHIHIDLSIPNIGPKNLFINANELSGTQIFSQTLSKTLAGLTFDIHACYLYQGLTLYGGKVAIPSTLSMILGIALVISLLTLAFAWSILTMRQRALGIASRMTTDLFRQEQKYRTLIQNAPGVIFSCTPQRNWRMDYLSDQFKEITGYAPQEFLSNRKRYIEIIHPDDVLKVEKIIGLKPKINHEYFLDYRIIHENGTVRWMHERAKVVRSPQNQELHLTGHFFDVTEQKEKEAEYRNLANALENAVNGVAFINTNGYHTRINESYGEIFKSTAQELQYKSLFELLSGRDQVALKKLIEAIDDKPRDVLTVEATTLDGATLYLYLVIVPAYSDEANKKMTGFYVFAKDVSNEARRENQLSEAVKAAEAANQTKSTFLATMSHELRTPLNAIIGYSDMLLEDAADDGNEMLVGDLKKINNSGRHLLTLINDILDVSKLEAGKMTIHLEAFDIQDVAQSMMDIIYPAAEKNKNTVTLNVDEDIGEMYSDLTKLRQMVFNLLSNACKFTKEGDVTIVIKALTKNNREFIAFSVKDSGIGIKDEQMAKLFQPFAQADSSTTRNFGGTGLGLTITKKFSEILGGEITVTSEYGVGTTFTITLPRNTRQEVADSYNNSDQTAA